MLLHLTCIFLISLPNLLLHVEAASSSHTTTHHHLSDPEAVVQQIQRQLESSHRRFLLDVQQKDDQSQQCLTGNPIDDCWRCDPNWASDRQHLADCAVGFGRDALGGKNGQVYVVTDSSDRDAANPVPGTLRHAAIQEGPLWITFASSMTIQLSLELRVNSFKTIDGRGADVHIAQGPCINLHNVTNVIIHSINIHNCVPVHSDGDGISVRGSSKIWIDHCSLSYCTDGLIDVTHGSTEVTISNNYFSHHDKVMLLGHNDDFIADTAMHVTVAFNRFGEELGQRMPRCRYGFFHVLNNDYTGWGKYAIGGSANPTINCQGNRFTAPPDHKEVTKRMQSEWSEWNWRSDGDIMVNGAFFVPSGKDLEAYTKASSMEPNPATLIDQLTLNVGVLGANNGGTGNSGSGNVGDGGGGMIISGGGGGDGGNVYRPSSAAQPLLVHSGFCHCLIIILFSMLC